MDGDKLFSVKLDKIKTLRQGVFVIEKHEQVNWLSVKRTELNLSLIQCDKYLLLRLITINSAILSTFSEIT